MKTFSYETAKSAFSVNKKLVYLHCKTFFSLSLHFAFLLRISIFNRFPKFSKFFTVTGFASFRDSLPSKMQGCTFVEFEF